MKHLISVLAAVLLSQAAFSTTCQPMEDFAVSYGIVRYYSPNPYTKIWSDSDWYKVCSYMVSQLDNTSLENTLRALAPSVAITEEPMAGRNLGGDPASASAYEHHGSGTIPVSAIAKLLNPSLARYIPYHTDYVPWHNGIPEPYTYYSYELPSGRFCNIVHCDSKSHFDKKGTSRLLDDAKAFWDGHRDPSVDSKARAKIIGLVNDRAIRVADIVVRWNIVRHFYPYYEEDALDWDNRLREYLLKADNFRADGAQVDDKPALYEWLMLAKEFMNPVKDGHMIVQYGFDLSRLYSSYVAEYYSSCPTIAVNDTVLVSIDGGPLVILDSIGTRSASEYLAGQKRLVNAATEKRREWLVSYGLLASATETDVEARWHSIDGESHTTILPIRSQTEPPRISGKKPPVDLDGGILYVDATDRGDFSPKKVLKANPGKIIFDLRGYPSYDFIEILEHLIDRELPYLTLSIPVSRFPFRAGITYEDMTETLKPKKPQLKADVVFLCDESTISWGETVLMLVKGYSLGTIIGSNTAGTNGDATKFNLPFFPFMMTGLKVRNIDGSAHHAIGVEPDIPTCNYAIDLLQGRDRILETAVAYMLEKM